MHYIFDTWHSGKHSQTNLSMIYRMLCKTICEMLYSNSGVGETEKTFSPMVMLGAEVPAVEGRLARERPWGLKSFKEPRILSKERGCGRNGVTCVCLNMLKREPWMYRVWPNAAGRNCGRVFLPLFPYHKVSLIEDLMLSLRGKMSESDFFYYFLRW